MKQASLASSRSEIGRGALWSVLGEGAGQALSLLLFLVIARFISKESFGLVAVSLATVELVRRLAIDPIAMAVNANPLAEEDDYRVCFTLIVLLSTALAILIFLFAGPVSSLIRSPEAAPVLRIVSVLLVGIGLVRTHGVWLARKMKFRILALRSIASVTLGGVVGVTMAFKGFDIWSLIAQQLAIGAANIATLWIATPWRPRPLLSWPKVRDNLRQSLQISFGAFWTSLANDSDIFFASAFLGPAVTGVYNAAKRILLAASLMLVNAISAVALPVLANLPEVDRRSVVFLNALALTSIATAPAFAGLAATAPELINVILGARWAGVAPILILLAASGYVMSISQLATAVLLITRHAKLDTLCSGVTSVLNLGLFYASVRFGPLALAACLSASAAITFPFRMSFAMRSLDIRWRQISAALLPSIVSAAGMVLAIQLLRPLLSHSMSAASVLPLLILQGVASYLLLLRLISGSLFRLAVTSASEVFARGQS